MNNSKPLKIAILAPYYEHVGTEKVMLTLVKGFAERGNKVDLIRADREWPNFKKQDGVRLIDLKAKHLINLSPNYPSYRAWNILLSLELLPKLALYLRRERPHVLITGLLNVVGVLGRELGSKGTKMIISIQGLPRPSLTRKLLWNYTYPLADVVITPTKGIAKKMTQVTKLEPEKIRVIHNPVVDDSILEQAKEPVDHPWFKDDQPPVILGVGRLTRQKDFPTLLRAFARVRRELPARLVILGEGEDRPKLEKLAGELGVTKAVDMPGFVDNPYKYMARADVFVLSSRWEGPGHVVIEAQAFKTPIVSTDCPLGPRDTLLDGRAGSLVPIGDDKAMSQAITGILRNPKRAEEYVNKGFEYIDRFRPRVVIEKYLSVIKELVSA